MKEKTPFRIVGGKDFKPATEGSDTVSQREFFSDDLLYSYVPGDLIAKEYGDSDIDQLMDIFGALLMEAPSIDQNQIIKELVEQKAREVKKMTVGELGEYLESHDLWDKPSATKAVMDEVAYRICTQNFSPRE